MNSISRRALLSGAGAGAALLSTPVLAGAQARPQAPRRARRDGATVTLSPSPTGNDSAQIRSAIATAGYQGTVRFNPGTYQLREGGEFDGLRSQQTFESTSGAPVLQMHTPVLADVTARHGVTWRNLTIRNQHDGTGYAITAADCGSWTFGGVVFRNSNSLVHCISGNDWRWSIKAYETRGTGIRLSGGSSGHISTLSHFRNCALFSWFIDEANYCELRGVRKWKAPEFFTPFLTEEAAQFGGRLGLEGVGVRVDSHHIAIDDAIISGQRDNGISLTGHENDVSNVHVHDGRLVGVMCYGRSNRVRDSLVERMSGHADSAGFGTQAGWGGTASDNTFTNCTATGNQIGFKYEGWRNAALMCTATGNDVDVELDATDIAQGNVFVPAP